MKTTTYILGGMVLGLFLLIAVGVATLYYFSTPQKTQEFHLSGQIRTQQLPACSVLKIVHKDRYDEKHDCPYTDYFNDSMLRVEGTSSTVPLFSFPDSFAPFFQVSHQADTVFITVDIPLEERSKHINTPYQALWLAIRGLRIQLPSSVQQFEVSLRNIPVEFSSMQQDSLFCRIDGTATVNSCHFRSLSMQADAAHYNSGTIDRLYMNLDTFRQWTVQPDDCHIGIEYLRGNGIHTIQPGECRKVYWVPEDSTSGLQLSLQQAVEINFPD